MGDTMIYLLEIQILAADDSFFVSIPESFGLLTFGICLVVIAVTIRSFLARGAVDKKAEKNSEDA